MIVWNDYQMKKEQYRDDVRAADQHRLVKLAAGDCQESAFGQVIRNRVSRAASRRPASDRVPCAEPTRLLEEAA